MERNEVNVYVQRDRRSFVGYHVLHLVLTVLTCGIWFPVWMIHWIIWLSTK